MTFFLDPEKNRSAGRTTEDGQDQKDGPSDLLGRRDRLFFLFSYTRAAQLFSSPIRKRSLSRCLFFWSFWRMRAAISPSAASIS